MNLHLNQMEIETANDNKMFNHSPKVDYNIAVPTTLSKTHACKAQMQPKYIF